MLKPILYVAKLAKRESSFKSCAVPKVKNGKIVGIFFDTQYGVGDLADASEPVVKIVCDQSYSLLLQQNDDNKVSCENGAWEKDFPACEKLCPASEISGLTTISHCERHNATIPCSHNLLPNTQASISCKNGYKLPKNNQKRNKLTCLESGKWDNVIFKCNRLCGSPSARIVSYVVKGKKADIRDIPWFAILFRHKDQICGSTILTEKILISSAHCVTTETGELNPKDMYHIVTGQYIQEMGADQDNENTQTFSLQEMKIPRSYIGYKGFFEADLAILVVNGYIQFNSFVAPICLDTDLQEQSAEANLTNKFGLVAGYGISDTGLPSSTLKKIMVNVVDIEQCKNKSGSFMDFVKDDKICAGNLDGSGVCQGDSGGGLVFLITNCFGQKQYYIRGVVSNGKNAVGSCDFGFYTMFTDVQQFIPFIKDAMIQYPLEPLKTAAVFSEAECKACEIPEILNGIVRNFNQGSNYEVGDFVGDKTEISIICDYKFKSILDHQMNQSLICTKGQWSQSFPECIPVRGCRVPEIPNGKVVRSQHFYESGEFVDESIATKVFCESKHSILSTMQEQNLNECKNGVWVKTFLSCHRKKSCIAPNISGAKIVGAFYGGNYSSGDTVDESEPIIIVCAFGTIDGSFVERVHKILDRKDDNIISCNDGKWNKDFPKCQTPCNGSEILTQTTKSLCEHHFSSKSCKGPQLPGTKAITFCKPGFRPTSLTPRYVLTCLKSGKWDGQPSKCTPICGLPLPITPTIKLPSFIFGRKELIEFSEATWNLLIYEHKNYVCSATIVSNRIGISSAHRFFDKKSETWKPKESFKAIAGKYFHQIDAKQQFATQEFKIKEIRTVPGFYFHKESFIGDIAILVLDGTIEYKLHISPICFDFDTTQKALPPQSSGIVSAFSVTGHQSQTKKALNVTILQKEQCKSPAFALSDKYCASYRSKSCMESVGHLEQVEDGGGLVVAEKVDKLQFYFIRGVVSGRMRESTCNENLLFTDIHEYAYYIKEALEEYALY